MNVVPFNTPPGSEPGAPAQTDAAEARQRMLGVKRKLEEASAEIEALQSSLASQQALERLLLEGRNHLQELRSRLQKTAAERDRLHTDLQDSATAHQAAVDTLERQMDQLRAQLAGEEAARKQFAEERADEQNDFKRLLDEASSVQRTLTEEVQEQRKQIHELREAAMRAHAFAREIMRTHEAAPPDPARSRNDT